MFFSCHPAEGLQPNVHVNGERLDVVEQFKYPGVVFDSNLTFRQHIKKMCNKIQSGKFPLYRTFSHFTFSKTLYECNDFFPYCLTPGYTQQQVY